MASSHAGNEGHSLKHFFASLDCTPSPYADYVESAFGSSGRECARFIRRCFRKEEAIEEEYEDQESKSSTITIIDSIDDELRNHRFETNSHDPVSSDFQAFLEETPPRFRTRLVLVEAHGYEYVNRRYIEAIGLHYKLNPLFFIAHFTYKWQHKRRGSAEFYLRDKLLPSEQHYLQLSEYGLYVMTATLQFWQNRSIIVVLEFSEHPHFKGDYLLKMLGQLMSQNKPDIVRRLDIKPGDYLLPCIKSAADPWYTPNDGSHDDKKGFWTTEAISTAQLHSRELKAMQRSIATFISLPEVAANVTKRSFRGVLRDYDILIKDCECFSMQIQVHLQQEANAAAIEETKKGLVQGESIRRLTVVAFIFLPLNFSTSFFGMNLKELNTGSTSIGWFVFLAILIGALSFALSVSIASLDSLWLEARRQYRHRYYPSCVRQLDSISKREIVQAYVIRSFGRSCFELRKSLQRIWSTRIILPSRKWTERITGIDLQSESEATTVKEWNETTQVKSRSGFHYPRRHMPGNIDFAHTLHLLRAHRYSDCCHGTAEWRSCHHAWMDEPMG
ncbi:MAG: hypothetical protein M1828_001413 [Chrysothrix sp. TS-e1954]|nr:MAG: hypothetical protein M1828_001413 [Chrysothrix sp. TS-e1954]